MSRQRVWSVGMLAAAVLLLGALACTSAPAAPSKPAAVSAAASGAAASGSAATGPAAPAPASAQPVPEIRRLMVGVSALSATALVQLVGMDYGIYARHGFEVEIQQGRPAVTMAALVGGELDYASGVDSVIRGVAAARLPLKVIAVSKRAPTFGMIVRPEIGSVQELRGKVISVTAATGANMSALNGMLRANGVSPQEVETLIGSDAPVQLQHLLQGLCDAAALSAPGIFEAQDRGYRMLVYAPDVVSFPQTGLVASDERIATRRDEARRMIVANTEIVEFIKANKEQAVESLVRRFGVSRELAAKTYDFEVPAYTADPRLDLREVALIIQEEVEAGLAAPIAPEMVVAVDLTEEAVRQAR
jgi:NitT/TauT family transport system substrate-binding protein